MPGDVIATGTGAGVGRMSGTYLAPGDHIKIEIEVIGSMENAVVTGS